jgi:hypothetical protein
MFVLVFFVSILMFQILRITVVTFSVPVTWLANLLDSETKIENSKKTFLGAIYKRPPIASNELLFSTEFN